MQPLHGGRENLLAFFGPVAHFVKRGVVGFDLGLAALAPGEATNTFGLGSAGVVYARTGSSLISCDGSGYYPTTPSTTVTRIVYVTGTGAEITLQDEATGGAAYHVPNACSNNWTTADGGREKVFVAQDGSELEFVADSKVLERNTGGNNGSGKVSGYLRFSNGTSYRIDNSTVTWIEDRNGNRINFSYGSALYWPNWYLNVPAPTQIVDQNGRTVTINYSDSSCSGCASISYLGAGGVNQEIKVMTTSLGSALRSGYSLKSIASLFPNTGSPSSYNYNPTVASAIDYPDGSSHTFQYNSYGELARVNLRTGGALEFDYGDGNNNGSGSGFVATTGTPLTDDSPVMIYRRLLTRREYASGGSSVTAKTTFSASYAGSGSGETTSETDTVYDANNNVLAKTVHSYNGNPEDALTVGGTGCNSWNEGFEYQTQYGTPNVLRTVAYALNTQSGCVNNPQVGTITTTNDTGQVSKVMLQYDGYHNISDKKETDWDGATVLRETKNTYASNAAYPSYQSYVALNLVRLPWETTVLDGAGNKASDTIYTYDQGNVANCPNIVGHDNTTTRDRPRAATRRPSRNI